MKRLLGGSLAAVAALAAAGPVQPAPRARRCRSARADALCDRDGRLDRLWGEYTGHDEPSLLFYSDTAGSGNSNMYRLQIPSDPKVQPKQAGTRRVPGTSSSIRRSGSAWRCATTSPRRSSPTRRVRPTATRTSSTAPIQPGRTTSASIRARRSSRCSSTRPAGRPGRRGSAATRRSGAPRWRSSALLRIRTRRR